MLLQITTWGVVFPTGMVLGVSRPLRHLPLFLMLTCKDHTITMARPRPSTRHLHGNGRPLARPLPRRPPIQAQRPRLLRTHTWPPTSSPGPPRHLPPPPHRARLPGNDTKRPSQGPRHCRQDPPRSLMGTDALRRHHRPRLLSRRPPRPMSRPLHHGLRLHRLRHPPHHPPASRAILATPDRPLSRILRLPDHSRLGLRQHLY